MPPSSSELARRTFYDTFAATNDPADMALYLAGAYSIDIQTRELNDRDITTLLVEEGGTAIAYAMLRADHVPECVTGPDPIELWRFYVDRAWHGRGVAAALMDARQDRCPGARRENAVVGCLGTKRSRPRVLCEMWFRRCRGTHILVRHRSADRSGHGDGSLTYEDTQDRRAQHRRHRLHLVPGRGPLRSAAHRCSSASRARCRSRSSPGCGSTASG